MVRTPCCVGVGLRKGHWSKKEDELLIEYIQQHGEGNWKYLPKNAGLLRCRKSCRLRWMNYLRPDIKKGDISPDEDDLIIRLHTLLGNRWSLIAKRLPGRTDNELKNYWNTKHGAKFGKDTESECVHHKPKKHCKRKDTLKHKKTKLYFPRPTRLSPIAAVPRNVSFGDYGIETGTVHAQDIDDDDHDMLEAMLDAHSSAKARDVNVDMMHEGYAHLLELEPFDDSMFDIEFESFLDSVFI